MSAIPRTVLDQLDSLRKRVETAEARVAVLEEALRPFAEAYRGAKMLGVPDDDDVSFPVPDLQRAAALIPE